ncbi:MAG: 4-alpha-glucanotransferase, partial [Candidatus Omnitrophica bacterium]|nr:4-alpha-glucanotransferase [Candidatus Omnitrophota bacterium]
NDELMLLKNKGLIPTEDELYSIHKEGKGKAFAEVEARAGVKLDANKPTVWMVRRLVDYKSTYPMLRFLINLMCADKGRSFTREELKERWLKDIPNLQEHRDLSKKVLNYIFDGRDKVYGLGMQVVVGGPEYERFWVDEFKRWSSDVVGLKGRFVYAPNSDAELLKMQAIGADICINIPRPLEEACGTSDQRTGLNGGVNIAIRGAGPVEWITDSVSGFLLDSYTKVIDGEMFADPELFYNKAPADIYRKLEYASDLFYADSGKWKKIMYNSYLAANEKVTAEAMEARYAKDVYPVAITNRKQAMDFYSSIKENPAELLIKYIKNNPYAKRYLRYIHERENLARYLDSNPSVAIPLKCDSENIKVYSLSVDNQRRIVAIDIGGLRPEPKSWTTVYSRETFEAVLGPGALRNEKLPIIYQTRDALSGKDYGQYATWQLLKDGLPLGVPAPGIQVLDLVETKERRESIEERVVPEDLADILAAAINGEILQESRLPVELLIQMASNLSTQPDVLRDTLRKVSVLDAKVARKKFTEEGIPAVMAFVATLAPELLEDMRDWDKRIYPLLSSIINSELNKNLFEKGKINFHRVTLNTAFVFSKSYNGRRVFIPIHFAQKGWSGEDSKVWLKIMDYFDYVEDPLCHKVFDYTIGRFYPIPHAGEDLAKHGWNVGISVFPGKVDKTGYIQHGLRFQILEFDPLLPENIAWWKDPSRINTAIIFPIFSLRHGKFKEIAPYFKEVLKPQGINVLLALPFYAILDESPYAPVSLYALNESYIDWSGVDGKQYDKEELQKFIKENAWWLEDYARFMALHEIIGKSSLEWKEDDVKRVEKDARYQGLVERHKLAQWIAHLQFKDALDSLFEEGGHMFFDMPMFRGKDSVDVWRHPEYFKDIKARNPGIVRCGINENWTDLALWNWTELSKESYRFILQPLQHWLDFGLGGVRLDALHFAYNFGNGQLASGDERGDDFISSLGQLALLKEKLFIAEAFEGKYNDIRKYGIMVIGEDWKQMSSHDSGRYYGTKEKFMEGFNGCLNDYYSARNAKFVCFTLGDQWGDPMPIKVVKGEGKERRSLWRYKVPEKSDPDYAERVKFDLGDYIETMVSAHQVYRRLKSASDLTPYPATVDPLALNRIPDYQRIPDILARLIIKNENISIEYKNKQKLALEEEDLLLKCLKDAFIGLANAPPELQLSLHVSYNLTQVAALEDASLKINRLLLNTRNLTKKEIDALRIVLTREILPHELKHLLTNWTEKLIRKNSLKNFAREHSILEALLYLHKNKINGIRLDSDWPFDDNELRILENILESYQSGRLHGGSDSIEESMLDSILLPLTRNLYLDYCAQCILPDNL